MELDRWCSSVDGLCVTDGVFYAMCLLPQLEKK
jgi:hypothetical protein